LIIALPTLRQCELLVDVLDSTESSAVNDLYPRFPARHEVSCQGGAVAQLGERLVRNEEVWGSIPHGSTRHYLKSLFSFMICDRIEGSLILSSSTSMNAFDNMTESVMSPSNGRRTLAPLFWRSCTMHKYWLFGSI
jgi:hypothetical protein